MDDPNTVIGAGLAVLATKDSLNRLLGPTADYIGEEAKGLVEKANVNLSAIFTNAAKKLGGKIHDDGAVNPRVFKRVWEEGLVTEDALAAEYFGGLLASARSPDGKDDRVLSLLSTVRDLSVFDLRLHYLVYSLIRNTFLGQPFNVAVQEDRVRSGLYIPFRIYTAALEQPNEAAAQELAAHSLITLIKHELIDHRFTMGPPEKLIQYCAEASEPGIVVIPSFFGAELYLWAHGNSGSRIDQFLEKELEFISDIEMTIEDGVLPLHGRQTGTQ